jgi:hypothetical protein
MGISQDQVVELKLKSMVINSRWLCSSEEYVANSQEAKLKYIDKWEYLKIKWLNCCCYLFLEYRLCFVI